MSSNQDNQDQYDDYQAQDKIDVDNEIADGANFLDPDVDINRSNLSKRVAYLFAGQYTTYPIIKPGNLSRVWWLVHNDVQHVIKDLEEENTRSRQRIADLEQEVATLREYKWMYEELE